MILFMFMFCLFSDNYLLYKYNVALVYKTMFQNLTKFFSSSIGGRTRRKSGGTRSGGSRNGGSRNGGSRGQNAGSHGLSTLRPAVYGGNHHHRRRRTRRVRR